MTEHERDSAPSITLADLRRANLERQALWCPDQKPGLMFRACELGGEVGEALNVAKKLERERLGWAGSRATREDLAKELADVVICTDLLAGTAEIDLAAAVVAKFNETSEKVGLPTRLLAATSAASSEVRERLAEAFRVQNGCEHRRHCERIGDGRSCACQTDADTALSALSTSTPAASPVVTEAERDVIAERRRQIDVEGWTADHDDNEHDDGDLAAAASCYALSAADTLNPYSQGDGVDVDCPPEWWPFDRDWWKPDRDNARRDLVKAGALILAEIERLDRVVLAAAKTPE